MVKEVRRQLNENKDILTGAVKPNYERCVSIATKSAIYEMFLPATIVLGTPLVVGVLFGPTAVAGVL